jgi:hypothetical protein
MANRTAPASTVRCSCARTDRLPVVVRGRVMSVGERAIEEVMQPEFVVDDLAQYVIFALCRRRHRLNEFQRFAPLRACRWSCRCPGECRSQSADDRRGPASDISDSWGQPCSCAPVPVVAARVADCASSPYWRFAQVFGGVRGSPGDFAHATSRSFHQSRCILSDAEVDLVPAEDNG